VDIFFVISGYLITSIIIKEINLNNKFDKINKNIIDKIELVKKVQKEIKLNKQNKL